MRLNGRPLQLGADDLPMMAGDVTRIGDLDFASARISFLAICLREELGLPLIGDILSAVMRMTVLGRCSTAALYGDPEETVTAVCPNSALKAAQSEDQAGPQRCGYRERRRLPCSRP